MPTKEEVLEVNAEIATNWKKRGEEPEVFEASPGLQGKVRDTLKKALQDQLTREIETIGGRRPDLMTIHGKSGVSNSPVMRVRED
jgi:hypothetical protein